MTTILYGGVLPAKVTPEIPTTPDSADKYKAINAHIYEIDVLRDICKLLDGLPADAVARVIGYLCARYGRPPSSLPQVSLYAAPMEQARQWTILSSAVSNGFPVADVSDSPEGK